MYWHTEGQFLTDGHRQFHATQSLFSFNLAQSHFNGALSYIYTATYRLLMQHSCINFNAALSLFNAAQSHFYATQSHFCAAQSHFYAAQSHFCTAQTISMQHSRISMQHSRISMQHSRISIQQRWPLSATVIFIYSRSARRISFEINCNDN